MSCISASAASVARASVAPSARASAARRGASVAPMRAARVNVVAAVDLNAVTVADTKKKFVDSYPYPIPSVWSVALQELLVTQHFVRYSTKYSYSKVSSLGFVSVFDQLFEGFPDEAEKDKIFECFVKALEEDPAKVRADAAELAAFAEGASGADADALAANPVFAEMKALGEKKKFAYSRYDAVGVFRMLELAGAADPAALESLVGAAGLQLKKVNGDLGMYKGLLSKLAAAKELQAEIFEREKRKTAEREAKKAEKAAAAEKKDE